MKHVTASRATPSRSAAAWTVVSPAAPLTDPRVDTARPWFGGQVLPAAMMDLMAPTAERFDVRSGVIGEIFVPMMQDQMLDGSATLTGGAAQVLVALEPIGSTGHLSIVSDGASKMAKMAAAGRKKGK